MSLSNSVSELFTKFVGCCSFIQVTICMKHYPSLMLEYNSGWFLCVLKSAVFIYCLCIFYLINHHGNLTDETFVITLYFPSEHIDIPGNVSAFTEEYFF